MPLSDGEEIALGAITLRALSLLGHTTDMTGLLIEDRALIGGDSLFADGIARPDLQRGDPEGARAMARTLHTTLHERVLVLGDDTVLLPGHAHPGMHAEAVAPRLAEVRAAIPELSIEDPEEFAREVTAAMPPRPANYEAIIAVNSGTHPFDPELETGANSCATRLNRPLHRGFLTWRGSDFRASHPGDRGIEVPLWLSSASLSSSCLRAASLGSYPRLPCGAARKSESVVAPSVPVWVSRPATTPLTLPVRGPTSSSTTPTSPMASGYSGVCRRARDRC